MHNKGPDTAPVRVPTHHGIRWIQLITNCDKFQVVLSVLTNKENINYRDVVRILQPKAGQVASPYRLQKRRSFGCRSLGVGYKSYPLSNY